MAEIDKIYKEYCKEILRKGRKKSDRTGTGTVSMFDYNYKVKVTKEFPLLTSKQMHFKGILYELLWFLKGSADADYLVDNDIKIWHGDLYKRYENFYKLATNIEDRNILLEKGFFNSSEIEGELIPFDLKTFTEKLKTDIEFKTLFAYTGPIYGFQWRRFGQITSEDFILPGVDQINELIELIKKDPDSRRLIVSAWNPQMQGQMILPPCHILFQCYTYKLTTDERNEYYYLDSEDLLSEKAFSDKELDDLGVPERGIDLSFYMRSNDAPLGHPYNIASYATLLHMIAQVVDMVPMYVHFRGGDCHIYLNQIDGISENLVRDVNLKGPILKLNKSIKNIDDFEPEHFELVGYNPLPKINIPLSN